MSPRGGFNPSYMIDQSHSVTDPIGSMLSSAEAITQCFAKARMEAGGATNVLATYRLSKYRDRKAQMRTSVGLGVGIV